jgi:hypothetical protein
VITPVEKRTEDTRRERKGRERKRERQRGKRAAENKKE